MDCDCKLAGHGAIETVYTLGDVGASYPVQTCPNLENLSLGRNRIPAWGMPPAFLAVSC